MLAGRVLVRSGASLLGALAVCASGACHGGPEGHDQAETSAAETFAKVCARCHGADGKGGVGPEGSNAPRNFWDASFQASRTDEELKQAIRKGKGGMPPFGNLFADPVLEALVRKVRSFNPQPKR